MAETSDQSLISFILLCTIFMYAKKDRLSFLAVLSANNQEDKVTVQMYNIVTYVHFHRIKNAALNSFR